MRAQATYRKTRYLNRRQAYDKGFTTGVWYGVIIAAFSFLGVLTLAAMYSPNGF